VLQQRSTKVTYEPGTLPQRDSLTLSFRVDRQDIPRPQHALQAESRPDRHPTSIRQQALRIAGAERPVVHETPRPPVPAMPRYYYLPSSPNDRMSWEEFW